ncbi:MAG: tetratricopeptide repeat protein [Bacteroidales bacterium]|nr:tetratricopeptide repeat protein [Bacteroidales bacterium]
MPKYNKNLDEVIKTNPYNAEIYNSRGVAKIRLFNYDEAMEDFDKAIEIDPNFAIAYYNRSIAKNELFRHDEAIEDLDKAIEIDPNFATSYYNRAWTKAKLSKHHEAIEDFSRTIEIDPNYVMAYNNRGVEKAILSRYDEAIKDFDKAIEIDPNFATSYYNRGRTKAELLRYDETIEDFSKAIVINPNYADAYYSRGLAKVKLSRYDEAIKDHSKAIVINPSYADAYNNRGMAKAELSRYDEAIEDYDKAIEIDPNSAIAYDNRGVAKNELSRHGEAIEDHNKAIEIDPSYATAYYNRGLTKYVLHNYGDAITDWHTCLYLSIKQKQKHTQHIYHSLKRLEAYPQNIIYTFEQFDLNISSYFHFQSACTEVEDFNLLLKHWEDTGKLKNRELLSAKALLYYYLGGNIQSFCIYDEELDDGIHPLSAQDLYYYALTAEEIGHYERQTILENCIYQLENKNEKSNEDYYYLGHLYLLSKENEKATELFKKSSDYKFSEIVLNGFIEEKGIELLVLGCEIDLDNGISQFSDYFHIQEYYKTTHKKGQELWNAFAFKNSFRGEANIAKRRDEANFIIDYLIKKYEEEANYLIENLTVSEKAKMIFEKIHDEGGDNIFKQIRNEINNKELSPFEPLEDKLTKHIFDLSQEPKYYLYYIQYEYLRGNLTVEQAFYLTLFLGYKINNIPLEDLKKAFGDLKISVFGVSLTVGKINAIAKSICSTLEEDNQFRKELEKADIHKKAYIIFKEDRWKSIRLSYDGLHPEREKMELPFSNDFIDKWGWFGW